MTIKYSAAALSLALLFSPLSHADSTVPYVNEYLPDIAEKNTAVAERFVHFFEPVAGQAEWIKNYGTTTPARLVTAGENEQNYLVFQGCKPHDCNTQSYLVLYNPKSEQFEAGALRTDTMTDQGTLTETKITWLGEANDSLTQVMWDEFTPSE